MASSVLIFILFFCLSCFPAGVGMKTIVVGGTKTIVEISYNAANGNNVVVMDELPLWRNIVLQYLYGNDYC